MVSFDLRHSTCLYCLIFSFVVSNGNNFALRYAKAPKIIHKSNCYWLVNENDRKIDTSQSRKMTQFAAYFKKFNHKSHLLAWKKSRIWLVHIHVLLFMVLFSFEMKFFICAILICKNPNLVNVWLIFVFIVDLVELYNIFVWMLYVKSISIKLNQNTINAETTTTTTT